VDAGTRWGAVEAAEGLPAGEPRRLELLAAALENELEALRRARDRRGAGAAPDPPRDEPAVRRALEATYRAMGKRAATLDERVALVDRANRVRPRSMT
jgi:serine/threonine-protein kinase PknG